MGSLGRVSAPRVATFRYADQARCQVADLLTPAQGTPDRLAVMVHGGFWRAARDRSLQQAVAADLVDRGWAVWNVDYRAVGEGPTAGGGWPQTYQDVAAALDLLAEVGPRQGLTVGRPVLIGHSAGGALALWGAGRHRLPTGSVGADPVLRPGAVVSQAGVTDLVAGAHRRFGDGAVLDLMRATPEQDPAGYANVSPTALLPLSVPILCVSGTQDAAVPADQSQTFALTARAAGDQVRLELVEGEDHLAHLDPGSRCWALVLDWLSTLAPTP